MKKIKLLIAGLFLLVFAASAQKADSTKKYIRPVKGTLKISPFDFVASTFTLGIETKIGQGSSLQFYPSFILNEDDESYGYNARSIGGAAEVQFKRFVYTRVPPLDGIYVGLFAKCLLLNTEVKENNNPYQGSYYYQSYKKGDYYLNQYSGGVVAGYQLIISQTLVLDAYVGGGVKLSEDNYDNEMGSPAAGNLDIFYNNNSSIFPKAGAKIGITF
jgi:hypothetical protein